MSEAGGSRDGVDGANNDDRPPPAKKAKLILSVVHEEFNVHQVWHSKKKQYVEGRRCKRCSHNFVSTTSANLKSHLKGKSHILLDPTYKMSTGLGYTSNDRDTFLNFCSVKMLRSVNLLMSIINVVLLYTITSHLHGLKVGNEI